MYMYTQHTRDTGLAAPDWRGERNTRGAHEHVGDTKRSTLSTLLSTRLLSSDYKVQVAHLKVPPSPIGCGPRHRISL